MSVEQPSTKRSKKADAKANASGSTVSAAADVNDHKHPNASLTLLRTHDDLIALAGLPLDHDFVIDNFKYQVMRHHSRHCRGVRGRIDVRRDRGKYANAMPEDDDLARAVAILTADAEEGSDVE